MNMVLWLDKRGSKQRLSRIPGYPRRSDTPLQMLRWLRVHGLPPIEGGISLTHMRWIRHARPDVYERTATFLEPMDYVAMRFSGRAAANQCTAFMSLLTDNRRLNVTEYDAGLLAQSGIDRDKLPELVPLDSILGTVLPEVAAELGLAPGTQVVTGINDTQCGGMGTAAFSGPHAALSIGSTSVMITHVDFKRTDVRHVILSMPSPVPDTYFVMAENGMAGGTLEHFLQKLVYASDHFGELTAANRFALLQRAVDDTPARQRRRAVPAVDGRLDRSRGRCADAGRLPEPQPAHDAQPHGACRARGRGDEPALDEEARSRSSRSAAFRISSSTAAARSRMRGRRFSPTCSAYPVHQMANPQYATCLGAGPARVPAPGAAGLRRLRAARADPSGL